MAFYKVLNFDRRLRLNFCTRLGWINTFQDCNWRQCFYIITTFAFHYCEAVYFRLCVMECFKVFTGQTCRETSSWLGRILNENGILHRGGVLYIRRVENFSMKSPGTHLRVNSAQGGFLPGNILPACDNLGGGTCNRKRGLRVKGCYPSYVVQ